jgi:hypothetical protein
MRLTRNEYYEWLDTGRLPARKSEPLREDRERYGVFGVDWAVEKESR